MAQNNLLDSPFPTAVSKGGTGVSSVTTAPSASAFAGWDANANLSAGSFIAGYATTATAAGTTTLTVSSKQQQYFTGILTQTVVLPVTSTLVLGQSYLIVNNSSGAVAVQSSGGNVIQAMAANTQMTVTCIATSGTGAASWNAEYSSDTVGVVSVSGTTNRITSSGGTTPAIDISASYAGQNSITTVGTIGTGVWQGTPIAAAYGGAFVLQCIQTNLTSVFNATSSSPTDITGLSVSITPKSASSRILVLATVAAFLDVTTATDQVFFNLVRASTSIDVGGAGPAGQTSVTGGVLPSLTGGPASRAMMPWSVMYIDSPGTTSATTYKLQAWTASGGHPFYINQSSSDSGNNYSPRGTSCIIVMELAS